jgi:hypothetical protein
MSKFGSTYNISSNTEDTECQAFLPVVRIGCPRFPRRQESVAPQGGRHTRLWGRGWGDPIPTMGRTLWYSRYTVIPLLVASLAPFVGPSCHDETATWVPLHHFKKLINYNKCAGCIDSRHRYLRK